MAKCKIEFCEFNKDSKCISETTAKGCPFQDAFTCLATKIYSKYPQDPDIWLLLQEVVSMRKKIDKICAEFGIE